MNEYSKAGKQVASGRKGAGVIFNEYKRIVFKCTRVLHDLPGLTMVWNEKVHTVQMDNILNVRNKKLESSGMKKVKE